jgi:hypothetical protein
LPDFAKLQSGGYSGTATLGLGYSAFEDRLNVAFLYGYVPASSGRSVQSLHFLLSFRAIELGSRALRWLPFYTGLGALCTWGDGYFLIVPKRYPTGYYYPTALRFTAHIGSELDWLLANSAFHRHGVYAELTTLDVFAFEYLKNPVLVDVTDIVSTSLGYRAAF